MFGNIQGLMPYLQQRAQVGREQIGPGGMVRQQPVQIRQQPQSMGGTGSEGLFGQYMSQIFNQKYRPQPLGGYRDFGQYGGFMPQRMMPTPQQASVPTNQEQLVGALTTLMKDPPKSYQGQIPGLIWNNGRYWSGQDLALADTGA
jgi:hypothetical protein